MNRSSGRDQNNLRETKAKVNIPKVIIVKSSKRGNKDSDYLAKTLPLILNILLFLVLKGLCQPKRWKKTNLKKSTGRFQLLSEILEGCFYLFKSPPSFDR